MTITCFYQFIKRCLSVENFLGIINDLSLNVRFYIFYVKQVPNNLYISKKKQNYAVINNSTLINHFL